MRGAITLGLSLWLSVVAFSNPLRTPPSAVPNANTKPAGSLANGVLTLSLDARRAIWHPNGDSLPGRQVLALAESSGPAVVPGPLVRVPAGTTVELTIRNTLDGDTIVFHVPPAASGKAAATADDSVAIAPGERGVLRFVASTPGNYFYRARTNDRLARALQIGGLMAGAVVVDSVGSPPSMRFLVEEPATGRPAASAGPGFSPPIVLQRGRPVSIMVVNHLNEPTAVHWHGMELDSYYDGVAGFGGVDRRISPIIAPRDSFEARFTPPRAGTFIYHTHANEPTQHRAGLLGALLVVDSALGVPRDDHTIFLKTARAGLQAVPLFDVNGQTNPDTIVLHAGQPARLRLISLALLNPNVAVQVTARQDSVGVLTMDSLLVQWRPLAKDGADLPESSRAPRRARQTIAMGETYDFELTPERTGTLRIEVRGGLGGRLLARVPVRVE